MLGPFKARGTSVIATIARRFFLNVRGSRHFRDLSADRSRFLPRGARPGSRPEWRATESLRARPLLRTPSAISECNSGFHGYVQVRDLRPEAGFLAPEYQTFSYEQRRSGEKAVVAKSEGDTSNSMFESLADWEHQLQALRDVDDKETVDEDMEVQS